MLVSAASNAQRPGSLALARKLTARNLIGLTVGQGKYAPMCNHNGALINDPVLLQVDEDEIWLSIADSDMLHWAHSIAVFENLNVTVAEPDVSPVALQGPRAVDVASVLFGDWCKELKLFQFRGIDFDGIPVVVARSGWSKQGGVEIYLRDGRYGSQLWDAILSAGRPFGIGPGAPNIIERIESGLISYGADTDDASNPFELGLAKFVDVDQPSQFIGKPALSLIRDGGIKRRFVGLKIEGPRFAAPSEHRFDLLHEGVYAGYVSAAAFSPRVNSNIAVALVSSSVVFAEEVVVVCDDGNRRAELI